MTPCMWECGGRSRWGRGRILEFPRVSDLGNVVGISSTYWDMEYKTNYLIGEDNYISSVLLCNKPPKLSGFLSIHLLNSWICGFACRFFSSELAWLTSEELAHVSGVSWQLDGLGWLHSRVCLWIGCWLGWPGHVSLTVWQASSHSSLGRAWEQQESATPQCSSAIQTSVSHLLMLYG